MQWLRTAFFLAAPLALAAAPFTACSNSSTPTSLGALPDASGPSSPRGEAGTVCGSATDCENGLSCLYPASATSTCSEYKVCVVAPPSPCPTPTTMCSCLAEPIQVCQGYAENPVDPSSTCDGGAVVTLPDAGDAAVPEAGPADAAAPTDAGSDATDAADAASE
jgi:hypothetical protein